MTPENNLPVDFFVMAGDRFRLDDAHRVLVRERSGPNTIGEIDPAGTLWLPERPPDRVLADVRTALSRMVVVMTMPKGLDVAARDGIGPVVTLPAYSLRFRDTWPTPVDCPFELVAIKIIDAQSTRVALRLATPKPPRVGSGSRSSRRRGKPPSPMDLFRDKAFEMARAQRWPPKVAAAFPRAVAGRRAPGDGDWPLDIAAAHAGLIVEDLAAGRLDTPTAKKFAAAWFVAVAHYDDVRRTVDPRARSPLSMLSRFVATRSTSRTTPVPPVLVHLVDEMRTQAGFDLRDPADARALGLLLNQAKSAGATTQRAPSRVRREWIEVPPGFLTTEPRAAMLGPTGWVPLLDRGSFEAGLAQLLARREAPGGVALPDTGVPIDAEIPVQMCLLETPDGIRLASPGVAPDDVRWVMPAAFHISGWVPSATPPPMAQPPATA